MFAKPTLTRADREWLASRVLNGSIPPEILDFVERKCPEVIAKNRREFIELQRGAVILAIAASVALLVAFAVARSMHVLFIF